MHDDAQKANHNMINECIPDSECTLYYTVGRRRYYDSNDPSVASDGVALPTSEAAGQ